MIAFLRTTVCLALIGAVACTKPSTGTPSGNLGGADCDPMVGSNYCGFPFPSSVYLVDDASTPTGKHVNFGAKTLPILNSTAHIDPSAFASSDGFSPGAAAMTYIAGADFTTTKNVPTQDAIANSVLPTSPTILLNAATGQPVPHFSEIDQLSSDPTDQVILIHPAVRLDDATRYIVAVQNVLDSTSTPVPPNAVFKALRDNSASSDPTVAPRRALYADIMAKLKTYGVTASNVQIAWDYYTASSTNNTSQLLSMYKTSLAALPATGPSYTIVSHVDDPDMYTARRIYGTISVPLFLDSATVTNDSGADIMTGYQMQRDASGAPKQNGFGNFEFVVEIPKRVETDAAGTKYPILIQGHGLFSDRSEGQDGTSSDYKYLLELANNQGYVTVALDLIGWRTPGDNSGWPTDTNPENDQLKASTFITQDAGGFRRMIDRGTQGMLNQLIAVDMMKTSFATDTLAQYHGGTVIDTTQAYYRGDSQGGILGVTFMALTKDCPRGYLGEPGGPYNLLLLRSTDFGQFLLVLQQTYGSARGVELVLGIMQMFWDRLEGDGFAPFVTAKSLDPMIPTHNVLMNNAIGDFQVTPLGAHFLARSLGAPQLNPANRPIYGITAVDGPVTTNAMLEFGMGVPPVPEADVPPTNGNDPHDKVRQLSEVYYETDVWLKQGKAQNFCGLTSETDTGAPHMCNYPTGADPVGD